MNTPAPLPSHAGRVARSGGFNEWRFRRRSESIERQLESWSGRYDVIFQLQTLFAPGTRHAGRALHRVHRQHVLADEAPLPRLGAAAAAAVAALGRARGHHLPRRALRVRAQRPGARHDDRRLRLRPGAGGAGRVRHRDLRARAAAAHLGLPGGAVRRRSSSRARAARPCSRRGRRSSASCPTRSCGSWGPKSGPEGRAAAGRAVARLRVRPRRARGPVPARIGVRAAVDLRPVPERAARGDGTRAARASAPTPAASRRSSSRARPDCSRRWASPSRSHGR